jgi:CelD/BcsL family acetyltransferase involved in cellulose biosynthesis
MPEVVTPSRDQRIPLKPVIEFRVAVGVGARLAVGAQWDALYARSGCVAPSMTGASLRAFFDHRLDRRRRAVVLLALDSGVLVGGLALVASDRSRRFRSPKAWAVGDVEAFPADAILDPRASPTLLGDMLAYLFASEPRLFSVTLRRVLDASPALALPTESRAFSVGIEGAGCGSYLDVPLDGADLMGSFSGNFRKNLRKQSARLAELSQVSWQFLRAHECRAHHLESLLALEAAGWKGRDRTAIACSTRGTRYYRDLVAGLAECGYLELHFLFTQDVLLAAQLAVRVGDTVTLLKIAYNEEYAAIAPGNMLFLELLRREAESQESRRIDCVTDMPWHANWKMATRRYRNVCVYPRRFWPTAFGLVPALAADVLRRNPTARKLWRTLQRAVRWDSRTAAHPSTSRQAP